MIRLLRRRRLLALTVLLALGACTIDPPDLILHVEATTLPGDTMRSEIRVLAGNGVVFHGIVPDGEAIVAEGEGVLFSATVTPANPNRGLPRRMFGAFTLTDPSRTNEAPLRVAVDEPLAGKMRWEKELKDWTFTGTRKGAEIRRKRP